MSVVLLDCIGGEIFRQILIQRVKFSGRPVEISHWPECESLITAFSLDAGVVGLSVSCGAGDKRIDAVLMFDKTRIFSFDCVEACLFLYQIKSSFLSLVFFVVG